MRIGRMQSIAVRLVVVLLVLSVGFSHANADSDQFTPVIVSPLTAQTQPFLGTDEKQHVVYELVLANTNPTPATIQKIEVLNAADPTDVVAAFDGNGLLTRLRTLGNTAAETPKIEFNGTRLFLVDLVFEANAKIPNRLLHRMHLLGAERPAPKPTAPVQLSYTVASFPFTRRLPEIGPPLAGKGWVALNGCCAVAGVHRSTGLAVNGRIYFAQRLAIDWMRMDDAGRLVHGDSSDVHNYSAYGAEILAVADGTVVSTLNNLDDQKPGTLPDPKTITLENVDGNHVVLDLGDGLYAFYAHMQKDSVTVEPGERVRRGQVLGKLGNTGNTSAPHLHFHLMDGPSVLGSNGLPYVIDSFTVAGNVNAEKFAAATGIEGDWSAGLLPEGTPRRAAFPMDLTIVTFPASKPPSSGAVVWLNP
jgi:Peptidase family M23